MNVSEEIIKRVACFSGALRQATLALNGTNLKIFARDEDNTHWLFDLCVNIGFQHHLKKLGVEDLEVYRPNGKTLYKAPVELAFSVMLSEILQDEGLELK